MIRNVNNSAISVFNRLRISCGNPELVIVLPIEEWDIPDGITTNLLLDGWYDEEGNSYDPADFWATKSIPVAYSDSDETIIEINQAGRIDDGSVGFYTYCNYIDDLKSAYAVINDGVVSKVEFTSPLTAMNSALIQFRCIKWD